MHRPTPHPCRPRRPARQRPGHPAGPPDHLLTLAALIVDRGRPYQLASGDLGCRWGQAHVCLTRLGHLYVLLPDGIHTVWDSRPGTPAPIRRLALDLIVR